MKRAGSWKPWYGGRGGAFQQPKAKPLYTVTGNNQGLPQSSADSHLAAMSNKANVSFTTDAETGAFLGWKLYFPEKNFKDSAGLVARIKTMQNHFETFIHWYNMEEIAQTFVVSLNLQSLEEDKSLCKDWPSFLDELTEEPTQTLACIGLAMHNSIVKARSQDENREIFQYRKIYCRPIGFEPRIKLSEACQTRDEMVSVTGTVKRVEPVQITRKMICFRCSMCSTELAVKQSAGKHVYPSSCHRGCPARGNFVELLSSPFTMIQPKQMIKLQESIYLQNQSFQTLNVELIQDVTNTVLPGAVVTVTGVVKYQQDKSQKFIQKGESKKLNCYLKCFTVEVFSKFASPKREGLTEKDLEFIEMMKAEPSPFRLMVHSLCPAIYGREEVKAGLILCLLSGNNLLQKRRSESHILLVGNPGTGKSKMLQACAELSMNGQFVSGPTSTAVGLTANIGPNGSVDAGSLILADGGACCIDEFDKMASHSHVLLESMEQQIVSITKCGVKINAPSRVVIIAAANPVGSVYDKTKTVLENIKLAAPLMSRFDLIFTLANQARSNDQAFMAHINERNRNKSMSGNSSFFITSSTASTFPTGNKEKLSWLYPGQHEQIDPLPAELLQSYIGYVREHIKPTLDEAAKYEILNFFQRLRQLSVGVQVQPITLRQLEALMRLTLARARADMATVATREHVVDVINLFKFTMIDVFDSDDQTDPLGDEPSLKKPKVQNVSSMSQAKQIKAFYEHLQSEKDARKRDIFTSAEMKDMANEIGIRDFYEIVSKLNMESLILKDVNGYKIV